MPEARAFLRDLTEHATQPQFVYAHKWQVGDMVMWDNRCLMHFAVADYGMQPRVMHRVTIRGDRPV